MHRFLFFWPLALASCTNARVHDQFVLRIAVPGHLAALDPFPGSTLTSAAQDLIYGTVLATDPEGRVYSRMATRWYRIGRTGLHVDFRPGLAFSDGSPVTPEDVIGSLAQFGLTAVRSGQGFDLESNVSGVPPEAVLLVNATLFKKTNAGYIGAGAFTATGTDAEHISLTRVKARPGYINKVEIAAFRSARDVFARLLRGEANAALTLEERQIELIEGIAGFKVLRAEGPYSFSVLLSPRLDAGTRRAIRGTLPLTEIIRAGYGDRCRPSFSSGPASDLPVGRPLEIMSVELSPGWQRAALAVRRALGARGGNVHVLDMAEGMTRLGNGDFDVTFVPNRVLPPSFLATVWHTGAPSNWLHYSNGRVDEALEGENYAAAQTALWEDAILIDVCRMSRVFVMDARIKNPIIGTGNLLETLPDWEVEP